jgi:membrane protein YdbS with pleckstrin-like domain
MFMKRHMTREEEFDILKLVLDKFLWLGVIIMGYGFYKIISLNESLSYGFAIMLAGAVILVIFMILLIKEYNFMK